MKLISLLFFILLSTTQIFAKKNFVVDKNLQKLRQEYRKFRIDKKILLDKSFFEIYNEIDKQLTEVQEPLERTYQIWSKSCSKFPIAVLDEETKKKFETFCANGLNLLANSLKIRQKALNTFFSGDLVSLSPPMYFFEDLCDEIEAQVDQIWGYYIHNNSSCVAIMFDSFLSLFSPVIDDVIKMGKNVKENVKKDFKNFQKTAKNTLKVVEKMVDKFDLCISVKDINSCMWKLVSCVFIIFK